MATDERRKLGEALALRLFGPRERQRAVLPDALREYTLSVVFGDLWQDDALSLRERELITSAMLIALNRRDEQKLHFTAAKNLGIERAEIEAVITHAAFYAGWPCAVSASHVLDEVWGREAGG
ncbi:MAG: carboxymuconolactone decarboxylase family protein [Pseudomonadales bacterium]